MTYSALEVQHTCTYTRYNRLLSFNDGRYKTVSNKIVEPLNSKAGLSIYIRSKY